MKIFLIGYMGSGKSSAGARIARKLGFDFIDLDEAFEQRFRRSVADHIVEAGEDDFRLKEEELLEQLSSLKKDLVISTGGGTPCFSDNIDLINRCGISVYLEMHPKSLAMRLENVKAERPLLRTLPGESLIEKVERHLDQRRVFYEKALITVKGENLDITALVEKIREMT